MSAKGSFVVVEELLTIPIGLTRNSKAMLTRYLAPIAAYRTQAKAVDAIRGPLFVNAKFTASATQAHNRAQKPPSRVVLAAATELSIQKVE